MADKTEIVRELYSRIASLPSDKAAIVSELANRMGIAGSNPGAQMQATARRLIPSELSGNAGTVDGVSIPTMQPGLGSTIGQAVEHMAEPGMESKAAGLSKIIRGVASAEAPLAIPLGLAAAPVATVGGVVGGTAAQQAVEKALIAAGVKPGYADLAGDVAGAVAGGAAAKGAPGAVDAVSNGARTAGKVVTNPAVLKSGEQVIRNTPLVGKFTGAMWDLATDLYKAHKAETAAPTKANPEVSSKVEISPKVSVESSSNALGTKPTVTAPTTAGKGYRTTDTLDADTQTALAKAAQSGKLNSLPADQKTTLVNAVKAGDNETVKNIVSGTAQGRTVDMNVANKVAILVKFAKDHNIDLEAIKPEDRQTVADGAIAYAKLKGHGTLPKSGRYKGISDETLKAVKDQLATME